MNTILTFLSQMAHYLLNYFHTDTKSLVTYLLFGGGISVILKFITKFKGWEKDKAIAKEVSLAGLSGLSAVLNWIINNYSTSPLSSLANVGPRLFLAAVFMHRILVNPLTGIIEKTLVQDWKDLKAFQAEKATATPAAKTPFN